jgi:hypothetical protein
VSSCPALLPVLCVCEIGVGGAQALGAAIPSWIGKQP